MLPAYNFKNSPRADCEKPQRKIPPVCCHSLSASTHKSAEPPASTHLLPTISLHPQSTPHAAGAANQPRNDPDVSTRRTDTSCRQGSSQSKQKYSTLRRMSQHCKNSKRHNASTSQIAFSNRSHNRKGAAINCSKRRCSGSCAQTGNARKGHVRQNNEAARKTRPK